MFLLALVLLLGAPPIPAKDWKIFCLSEKHLDVGWSFLPVGALDQEYPGSVDEYQVFSLGRAIQVRAHTANYPRDAQYRWFVDAAWQIEAAERFQPRLIPKLRQLINDGEFSYNPIYANLHTMCIGHEQLMRMMAYGRLLESRGFRRSPVASASDAFSVGWGYASALASAGVKYFIKGTWYSGPSVRPGITRVEPAPLFRWVGPDGKKVLFFYYGGYTEMAGGPNEQWGQPLTQATIEKNIRRYEDLSRQGKWPYDAFPLFGSEGDFGIPSTLNSDFIRDWNKSHPSVRLIMATPEQFFDYIEIHFADKVPDGVVGGWGVSHDVEETTAAKSGARARANDHLLLAAEAFASVLPGKTGQEISTGAMRQLWLQQVLYHEHSFGIGNTGPSADSRRQYAWRNRLTEQVEEAGKPLLDGVLQKLARQIAGGERVLACMNSLSFPQTGVVEIALDKSLANGPVRVVDAETGRELPSQILETGRRMRFRHTVPALGYNTVRVETGVAAVSERVQADAQARTLENEFYRVVLTPDGSLASVYDKEANAEVFESGGTYRGNHFIFKDDAWRDHSPASAEISVEAQGCVSATLKAVSAPMGIFPRSTRRYTLHAGLKRLDIENSFTKEPGRTNSAETVFYAFPFAVPKPVMHVDIPGVVARYPEEFRPETEWTYLPAQSFVSASNGRFSVILATREAPNFAFRSMRKFFEHRLLPDIPNATVFAMPLTKQSTNRHDYDFAGGSYQFHYALTTRSGPLRPAEALRFGLSFQRGLTTVPADNSQGAGPQSKSFLRLEPQDVLVSALKPADDGRGLILRLWNPEHRPMKAALSLPGLSITGALRTDVLERDAGGPYEISAGSVLVPCAAREFVTVRLLASETK